MLAHAFLSVIAATQPEPAHDDGLIALTRNEIRRLFMADALHRLACDVVHRLH